MALARFGRDLTAEAQRGLLDPVLGRDALIKRVLQVRSALAGAVQLAGRASWVHQHQRCPSVGGGYCSGCRCRQLGTPWPPVRSLARSGRGAHHAHKLCPPASLGRQVLLRRSKGNPLLIGDAGVGKTAIVEGLAQLMAGASAPPS